MKDLRFEVDDKHVRIHQDGRLYSVAIVYCDDTSGEAKRLARLFCAAPDLLEALKAILPAAGDGYGHNPHAKKPGDCAGCDAVVAARAAIAKAEGKS